VAGIARLGWSQWRSFQRQARYRERLEVEVIWDRLDRTGARGRIRNVSDHALFEFFLTMTGEKSGDSTTAEAVEFAVARLEGTERLPGELTTRLRPGEEQPISVDASRIYPDRFPAAIGLLGKVEGERGWREYRYRQTYQGRSVYGYSDR
jgi:hypothetical protein